ncbi:MAG TPA: hypothetical protein VK934_05000 [Fimbriimonas sp.]|nr:hypothetical protein [Fimbriimonas sp.]
MKQLIPLFLLLLVGGCQGGSKPAETTPVAAEETYTLGDYRPSHVASTIALKYKDKEVHVGDKSEDTYEKLLDGRTGGFVSELLPKGLKSPYTAHIWQGADDAFGVISYEGKAVVAMVQEMRTNQEHANNVRTAHQDLMGSDLPQIVAGEKVTYYFWEKDLADQQSQRLMIMVFQNRDNVFLTTAIGDARVMDVLAMSPAKARDDQVAADEILRTREAGANAAKK